MQKPKLKISMLGHKRIPSREGGVEIVVENLAVRMVQAGHEVTCYNRRGHHVSGKEFNVESLAEYEGVRLKSVFTATRKGLAAMTSSAFAALYSAFGRYDVVHFHAEGPCAMLWLPKLFGKRCVATIHGLDWQRAKWGGFAVRYLKFGEWVAARFSDELIVLTEGAQRYFKDVYGRDSIVIPNGVSKPEPVEPDEIERRFGLEKDDYILFLGRIVPEKGLRYLVDAFRKVKTDKKLVIAGGSSDTDAFIQELKQVAGGDERIIFTGFVQGRILDELYSNAYIYALPSDVEGMPLSLLEALSYGNCCLISDIEACTSVVEDSDSGGRRAAVFRKSDVDDLRAVLQRLCDDPVEVEEFRDGVSDFVCNKYSWDKVAEQTTALYYK
ncbi:MAG: glycosyltransferase family 4 protein [Lautropia sp.]|nr:glycosyltransferase family 4 protein [Lautropia sp.]